MPRTWMRACKLVSAALCCLLVVGCVASRFWALEYMHNGQSGTSGCLIHGGALFLFRSYRSYPTYIPGRLNGWALRRQARELSLWPPVRGYVNEQSACAAITLWVPVAGLGALALLLVWRTGKRRQPEACRNCGYDLTGNVSGICPECGTPIPEEVKATLRARASESGLQSHQS
jgi:hypothetical protein